MTCIVGIEHATGVFIGGDSALSSWAVETLAQPKVFRVGKFVIGACGSARVLGLLQHAFLPPKPPKDPAKLDRFMHLEFVPALRACMAEHGAEKKENEITTLDGAAFLVGVRGRLFQVESDYQVNSRAYGYCAVGSGYQVALGALHATHPGNSGASVDAPDRLLLALTAAAEHNPYVRPPFTIEVLPATQ